MARAPSSSGKLPTHSLKEASQTPLPHPHHTWVCCTQSGRVSSSTSAPRWGEQVVEQRAGAGCWDVAVSDSLLPCFVRAWGTWVSSGASAHSCLCVGPEVKLGLSSGAVHFQSLKNTFKHLFRLIYLCFMCCLCVYVCTMCVLLPEARR